MSWSVVVIQKEVTTSSNFSHVKTDGVPRTFQNVISLGSWRKYWCSTPSPLLVEIVYSASIHISGTTCSLREGRVYTVFLLATETTLNFNSYRVFILILQSSDSVTIANFSVADFPLPPISLTKSNPRGIVRWSSELTIVNCQESAIK